MNNITGNTIMPKPKRANAKKSTIRPAAKKTTARTGTRKPAGGDRKALPILPQRPAMSARSRKSSYSKQDLEHFRGIILEKKKEILEELETLRDSMMDAATGEYASESSTYSTHMEQGTDAMEREKTFLFASREGKFLNYLEDALQRIDKGEYGTCSECGKLIEKERLEAVPHARQCLQCKMNLSK
ncbi:MAG TPA: TraR/DksA C4-type zinc finger protein [Bacteroidota bacterium]|nr:TraR/DksA C4-type zinc finger protein [Bacteroidota bacterium]